MIVLRQGKAKNILENSINSALTAVETYNRPRVQFRIENYIILMIIAWTKLFHAYFQSEIGERYFYKEKNGRYKKIDGERKAWELTECIKEYQKMRKPYPNLTDPVVANLRFFIGIRNKIEHRYWDSSSLDISVEDKTGVKLSQSDHTLLWKSFRVRPTASSEAKFDTISKFCIYDEPHNDYLYTDAWVTFIAGLFEKHGFTKENIRTNCVQELKVTDYEE